MSQPKYPLLSVITTILQRFVEDEDSISFFVTSGCGPERFPKYSVFAEIRRLGLDFLEQAEFGHQGARVMYRDAIEKAFLQHGISYRYPKEELVYFFRQSLNFERASRLGAEILANPLAADDAIAEFQAAQGSSVKLKSISEVLPEFLNRHDERILKGNIIREIPGWELLAKMIGGFNPGRFSILYADTGFGKTNIGIHLALAASRVMPAGYYNMEMVEDDFLARMTVAKTGMTYKQFYGAGCDHNEIFDAFSDSRFKFTDGKDLSTDEVVASMLHESKTNGTGFFVVDYDQKLVMSEDDNLKEWKQLQRAAVQLENAAKKTNSYVLLLAQSNFEGGISGSKRIAFGAYTVMRFYHHEESSADIIECIKNRGGIAGACLEVEYKRDSATIKQNRIFQKQKKVRRETTYG